MWIVYTFFSFIYKVGIDMDFDPNEMVMFGVR